MAQQGAHKGIPAPSPPPFEVTYGLLEGDPHIPHRGTDRVGRAQIGRPSGLKPPPDPRPAADPGQVDLGRPRLVVMAGGELAQLAATRFEARLGLGEIERGRVGHAASISQRPAFVALHIKLIFELTITL